MVNSSKNTVNLESLDTNIIESVEDTTSTTSSLVENIENEMVSTDGTIKDSDNTLTPTEKDVESQEDTLQNEDGRKDNKFVAFMKSRFKKKSTKGRIWEIDFLRGFCVFLMLFDHAALMLATTFGPSWYGGTYAMQCSAEFGAKLCTLCLEYWNSTLREIGHPIVLFIFFSISGLSCSFSRSNLKRGAILAVVSVIYSLVTYVLSITMDPSLLVTFGVLHFYAVCILVWAIICKLVKDNKVAKTIISGFIVIVVAVLYFCYKAPATTPKWLFFIWPRENFDGTLSSFYYQYEMSPGDLFTLVPYSAFFFAGTFLQPLLYSKRRSLLPALDRGWHRPITFLGRHAIGVYLSHIVLVAVVLCLISLMFYGTWGLF